MECKREVISYELAENTGLGEDCVKWALFFPPLLCRLALSGCRDVTTGVPRDTKFYVGELIAVSDSAPRADGA